MPVPHPFVDLSVIDYRTVGLLFTLQKFRVLTERETLRSPELSVASGRPPTSFKNEKLKFRLPIRAKTPQSGHTLRDRTDPNPNLLY